MKTSTTRKLMTRACASLIAAAGMSFCIGGTLFLMSMPGGQDQPADYAAQSAPVIVAQQD